jgi:hypothetical protein
VHRDGRDQLESRRAADGDEHPAPRLHSGVPAGWQLLGDLVSRRRRGDPVRHGIERVHSERGTGRPARVQRGQGGDQLRHLRQRAGASSATAGANNVGFGTGSSYFNVVAGTAQQVRITNAGSQAVVLDVGSRTFTAGQNVTLVITPPFSGSPAPRAFYATGC